MTINQHKAVIQSVQAVLGEGFKAGVDIKTYITEGQREKVEQTVTLLFISGEAEMSDEAKTKYFPGGQANAKELKRYVNGLVTNWFNKSKELNGNVKYEAKNPGSRAGSGDEQVKEMKNLQKVLEAAGNTEGAAKVAQAITSRLELLKAESSAKSLPKVDVSKLPEHLRALIEEEV